MAVLQVRVQPGARRTGFVGWYGDTPKLAVAAPPVDGAANAAVERDLAKMLGVRRNAVSIVSGRSSRTKRVEVVGVDDDDLQAMVTAYIGDRQQ